jgi:hypothetical protein
MTSDAKWETVCDEPGDQVRRIAVPGGWLYQTWMFTDVSGVVPEAHRNVTGWSQPVFVPGDCR